MNLRTAFAIAIAVSMVGCATIPEDKCATTDWYALGLADGKAGYPTDRLLRHRDACKNTGVAPDEGRYLEGRKIGLNDYCQLGNAVPQAMNGNSYAGVCSDPRFARLHAAAERVYVAKKKVDTTDSDIRNKETEVKSDKTSDKRKSELRDQIRDLDRQRSRERDDRSDAERALDRLRREFGV